MLEIFQFKILLFALALAAVVEVGLAQLSARGGLGCQRPRCPRHFCVSLCTFSALPATAAVSAAPQGSVSLVRSASVAASLSRGRRAAPATGCFLGPEGSSPARAPHSPARTSGLKRFLWKTIIFPFEVSFLGHSLFQTSGMHFQKSLLAPLCVSLRADLCPRWWSRAGIHSSAARRAERGPLCGGPWAASRLVALAITELVHAASAPPAPQEGRSCGRPHTLPSRLKTSHLYFFRTFSLYLGPSTSEVNDGMPLISTVSRTAQQRGGRL